MAHGTTESYRQALLSGLNLFGGRTARISLCRKTHLSSRPSEARAGTQRFPPFYGSRLALRLAGMTVMIELNERISLQKWFSILLSRNGAFLQNRQFASVTGDVIILNRTPVAFADHDG